MRRWLNRLSQEVTVGVRALPTMVVAVVLAATPPAVATGALTDATSATTTTTALAPAPAPAPGDFSSDRRLVRRSPDQAPEVTAIRVAHHRRFDRIVIDLRGRSPGFDVRYVRQLHRDGRGNVVNLLGPASLEFVLSPASGHDPDTSERTLGTPARTKWRLDQVRETAVIGDFEADFTLGVGLARRAAFRVLTLRSPPRSVLDVHH